MVRDSERHMRYRRHTAFTLVEIMIVVSIIALLTAIALPSFMRARRRSQNAKFVNDLRVASGAFEMYAAEHNGYPPNVTPGVVPPGMDIYFGSNFNFTAPTPIGGNWDWANRKVGNFIGVSVFSPTADDTQMQEIDAIIDDGDLTQGSFQKASSNRYISILQ
jgi:prepilin-type N-terminal cleavage/methylation domain-containing protein